MTDNPFLKYLPRHIPQEAVPYTAKLLQRYPCQLNVVPDRKTKQGDYRPPQGRYRYHRISVNAGLNPYAFLVTLIHEVAHMEVWQKHQHRVKPHGQEFRHAFRELMAPLLAMGFLPEPVTRALAGYLIHPAAATCTDANLYRVLRQYDEQPGTLLEELPADTNFYLQNGRLFTKKHKKRTRYVCQELATGKKYLIHGLAEVKPVQ